MSNVLPPPILVVRPHRTARRWRWPLALALLWLASLAAVPYAMRYFGAIGVKVAASRANTERDNLLQKVALAERAEQVARAANADLQQGLRDRQEEIAGLRADLAFYSKLTDGRSKPEGLAVHGVRVGAGAAPRVYNFTVTLTQTLKSGQIASGHVRLAVDGIANGKLSTVTWQQLAPNQDASGLSFSFKYFQQVAGTLMLPADFTPNRIQVEADAGAGMGRAEQEFAWADALADQESANVQKQD
jgi:hypothetical protein